GDGLELGDVLALRYRGLAVDHVGGREERRLLPVGADRDPADRDVTLVEEVLHKRRPRGLDHLHFDAKRLCGGLDQIDVEAFVTAFRPLVAEGLVIARRADAQLAALDDVVESRARRHLRESQRGRQHAGENETDETAKHGSSLENLSLSATAAEAAADCTAGTAGR